VSNSGLDKNLDKNREWGQLKSEVKNGNRNAKNEQWKIGDSSLLHYNSQF